MKVIRSLALLAAGAIGCLAVGPVFAQVALLPPVDPGLSATNNRPGPGGASAWAGMSLNEIVATVLMSDPRLRVGKEDINLAVADAITASLKPNPTLDIDGQLIPLTRPFSIQEQGGPPQFDAIVGYPIDWFLFGKRKAAMASRGIAIQQTESEYYDLVRQRVRDASVGYFDVLELKALRDVARQDVENLERVESIIRRAAESGARPTVDASRVMLDLLKSRQLLRDADVAILNAKTRLQAIMGRANNDPTFEVAGSLELPAAVPAVSTDEAVAIAMENRPDLAALRHAIAKAEADIVAEHRKAFPAVTARAGYTRQFQGSIGFRDTDTFLVGLEIGLPFSDRNQGNRAWAASRLSQSRFELEASQVALRSEIEQAINEFRLAEVSAQAVAQDQLRLAESVRDSINKANEAGGRPLIDVLDAQRNYRETYRLYIASRANYWRASVRLSAAMGKKIIP